MPTPTRVDQQAVVDILNGNNNMPAYSYMVVKVIAKRRRGWGQLSIGSCPCSGDEALPSTSQVQARPQSTFRFTIRQAEVSGGKMYIYVQQDTDSVTTNRFNIGTLQPGTTYSGNYADISYGVHYGASSAPMYNIIFLVNQGTTINSLSFGVSMFP